MVNWSPCGFVTVGRTRLTEGFVTAALGTAG